MRKRMLGALSALCLGLVGGTAANASLIPTLINTTSVADGTRFTYDVLLTADQGLSSAGVINPQNNKNYVSRLVIFDFAGYVDGSIFTSNSNFTASTELVSTDLSFPVGAVDDPSLVNLVFTYNGPEFRTTEGVYDNLGLGDFGAISQFAGTVTSFFSAVGVKNVGADYPSGTAGTAAYNAGSLLVPGSAAIPEPASWAMMVFGFGVLGSAMRRRRPNTLYA